MAKVKGITGFPSESLLKYAPPLMMKKPRASEIKRVSYSALYAGINIGDEVLDILLSPREYEDDKGDYFVQKVSRTPATARDSEKLREDLDRKLFERGARMAGPCVIRRELYAQTLDELIRQETIACAENGILLAAWRDHCIRNLKAYEDLFVSRLVIENEKYLKLAQRKLNLHERLSVLAAEERTLTLQVTRAKARFTHACEAREEHTKLESEKQKQNVESLREDTQQHLLQLKARLKEMKSGM